MENYSAEELMVIYQQKSPELATLAFRELYCRFSSKAFSFLIKKCKNQADAEDLLQKVFIKIHESKHLYKKEYKFEQWLFVIARTQVLDFFRSQKRYLKKIESHEASIGKSVSDTEIFNSLDEDQKEMLEMKYIDEMSYLEMARHFNKSEGSLRKMVSRMVINLKKGEV